MSVGIDRIVTPDAEVWDEIWSGCDYATFFHSRHWLESWASYTGGARENASRLVTFDDGARAVVVLSRRRRAGGLVTSYESGPRGTYGGWVSSDELGEGHARALVEHLVSLGNIAWYSNPFDTNAAVIHGAGDQDNVTDALVLSADFDDVLATWSSQHRRSVRKADREGVVVREASGLGDWEAYFQAYRASLDRWGDAASDPYAWEMFESVAKHPQGQARLWLALVNDRVAAGAVCGYARRHVVYWHGAAHSEFFKKRPVHKLFHSVIADACERGYGWFDFNPSGGLEGVRNFKRGFGTAEFQCPTILRESGPSRLIRRLGGKRS